MSGKSFARLLAAFLALVTLIPMSIFAQGAAAPKFDEGPALDTTKDYYAAMHTTLGTFKLRLFADQAPITVRNFVNLAEGTREFKDPRNGAVAKRPYFDGVAFHRVIPNFMIQGGDPTATGTGSPGYRFKDEFVPSLNFTKGGILAMANSGPATNGSQFFITEVPTPHLNQRHTIFGEVTDEAEGIALVKKIANSPRNERDKPKTDIRIEKLEIIRVEKGTKLEDVKFPEFKPAAPAAGSEAKGS